MGQLLPGQPEFVDTALADQGDPVGRGDRAEREGPLEESGEAGDAPRTPVTTPSDALPAAFPLGRRLGDGAIDQNMAGGSDGNGETCGDHRFHLGRSLGAAVVPVELEAEGILDFGGSRAGKAGHAGPGTGVGGQPVDVLPGQPGVGDGIEAGVDSQIDVGSTEPATDV